MKKNTRDDPKSDRAFTRLELVMIVATLVLLAGVALPLLAGSKQVSERTVCFSNLRQMGHAFHLWANDHGDRNPWITPVGEGGTFGSLNPIKNNAWWQMQSISNELVTPKILVCPSDLLAGDLRKMASDFSITNFNGGFAALPFRNNALSYIIGLHSVCSAPRSILSGDRNLTFDGINGSCATGVGDASVFSDPSSSAGWTNAIHGTSGDLLFTDGGVENLSTTGLRRAVNIPNQVDNGQHHFLAPY